MKQLIKHDILTFLRMIKQTGSADISKSVKENQPNFKFLLIIVYIALFLDGTLMSTIVPILPAQLQQHSADDSLKDNNSFINETDQMKVGNYSYHLDQGQLSNNVQVGLILGSKALVQLLSSPAVGFLADRIGYKLPLSFGSLILLVSSVMFALSNSFYKILIARAIHGLGSACCRTAGLGFLAATYTDDSKRGWAMSIALGGFAVGLILGYPLGGVLYEITGKAVPFLTLACLALAETILVALALPSRPACKHFLQWSAIIKLLVDPRVIIIAGAIFVSNASIATLEPTLSMWMTQTMGADPSTIGLVFLPLTSAYLIGIHLCGPFAHQFQRWRVISASLIMCGVCLALIPSMTNVYQIAIPNSCLGFTLGAFDSASYPHISQFVDQRNSNAYGCVLALADALMSCAFAFCPFVSGPLVDALDFRTVLYILSGIIITYSPFIFLTRNAERN